LRTIGCSRVAARMLLYYITDRRQFRGSEWEQRRALLNKISEAARNGVDYIQLREKDLSARELLRLAQQAREKILEVTGSALGTRNSQLTTGFLINSRIDVALVSGANGVHLRGDDISAADARAVWMRSAAGGGRATSTPVVAVSCHSADDVRRAEAEGADFVVFAPVFGKGGRKGVGLEALRAACRDTPKASGPEATPAVRIPVLALGGVTLENASPCMEAGAAGIAGIRLFQENDIAEVVKKLLAISF
jgi:thiamine-phosphate pyrophosphorylase